MESNSLGHKTLKLINEFHRKGIKSYVALIRHSSRYYGTVENEHLMELTEEGRQAAYEFGRAIISESLIRFYSSPVNRCVETAEFVEKGFLSTGGKTIGNTVLNILTGFYVKDRIKVIEMIMRDSLSFYRKWFSGKISVDDIDDSRQSAKALLNALYKLLQESEGNNHINICVTHDINLYLLKEFYFNQSPEHYGIEYLEGVIIYKKNNAYYMINHEKEEKLPLF